jgi:hypothetical protein
VVLFFAACFRSNSMTTRRDATPDERFRPEIINFVLPHYRRLDSFQQKRSPRLSDEEAIEAGIDAIMAAVERRSIQIDNAGYVPTLFRSRIIDERRRQTRRGRSLRDVAGRVTKIPRRVTELFALALAAWALANGADLLFENKVRRRSVKKLAADRNTTSTAIRRRIEADSARLRSKRSDLLPFVERFLEDHQQAPLAMIEAVVDQLAPFVS